MDPVVGGIIVALLAALGSYLAAAKKMSGKINTSDASELWAESKSIREWSAERIALLTQQVSELEQRVEVVEGHNMVLVGEKTKLAERNVELLSEIEAGRRTISILTKQLNISDDQIEELQKDIKALEGRRQRDRREPQSQSEAGEHGE